MWPYLFESHRSPQMYDLLSAYFTNRVIRMLRNGICVFKPHFVELEFTGVYIMFLISVQKHILWVLVTIASARWF